MLIDFDKIVHSTIENFRGGEKNTRLALYADTVNRIAKVTLRPGASIGLHRHTTSSEIIFVVLGTGVMTCDGVEEELRPGLCSYCPIGSEHTLRNTGQDELVYYAVIPEHTVDIEEIREIAEEDVE